jgi:signal transduction histidine kinase
MEDRDEIAAQFVHQVAELRQRIAGLQIAETERQQIEDTLLDHSKQLEKMVVEHTRALEETHAQSIRREKLALLGQLARGVGHELRQPLGAISNAVYFLNMALEEPDADVEEALEILAKEVGTAEKIIGNLLDFARTRHPLLRTMNVNDAVRDALARVVVPENVEVVSQLTEALPTIQADSDQLGQAFDNIIRNGIQAMPQGGRLIVKSEASPPEWLHVSFTDTGVGIPEENLGKIFEPLFTTRPRGIGLGATIVKALIDGHGGGVEVKSKVGKGSTFTVRLPVVKERTGVTDATS